MNGKIKREKSFKYWARLWKIENIQKLRDWHRAILPNVKGLIVKMEQRLDIIAKRRHHEYHEYRFRFCPTFFDIIMKT